MTTEGSKENNLVFVSENIPRDAFEARGSLADWCSMARHFNEGDYRETALVARFCLYAGFASVALEPWGLRPFIIHLCGDTSKGKTTALKVVASIYGKPEEGKAITTWHGTVTAMMRRAETLKNLPMIMDELSGKDQSKFRDIVYTIEGGMSKAKASREDPLATVPIRTWRLGFFSSGEPPMLDESALGGEAVRVWEFHGSPFGENRPELIRAIETTIPRNYGLAGRAFVRTMLKVNGDKVRMMDSIGADLQGINEAAWNIGADEDYTPVERRMLRALNAIYAAGAMANHELDLRYDVDADMARIFEILRQPVQEKIRTVDNMIAYLRDYVEAHPTEFPEIVPGVGDGTDIKYPGGRPAGGAGIKGYIFNEGQDLGIIKTSFNEIIDAQYGRGRSGWALNMLVEKGIVFHNPDSKHKGRKQMWIAGRNVPLVYFADIFSSEGGGDDLF